MLETATYLVTKEIAIRSGLIQSRYRVADGRFVLNNRDLSRVRFSPDEYINGLEGVEKVSSEYAKTLIRQNNFRIGAEIEEPAVVDESETAETESPSVDNQENANTDETTVDNGEQTDGEQSDEPVIENQENENNDNETTEEE